MAKGNPVETAMACKATSPSQQQCDGDHAFNDRPEDPLRNGRVNLSSLP